MSPKRPAMPKVDTEERTVAAFVFVALLPLAVGVPEPVACELLLPVLDATLDAVPEPESWTAVFKQLVSEPATMVAWPENARVPVLSLRAALKLVLA